MPPKWFAACFGRTNAEDGHVASASAAARRAGYEDDGISVSDYDVSLTKRLKLRRLSKKGQPAKSDSKRSSNMFGSGKGNAKGGDVAAWGQDVDGGGAEGPGNSARKLRIISTTNGPSGPLPDSPSAKLRTSKKHLRAHLKQAQPKRSILKRGGTDSMAGGGDVDIDALDDGEAPWDVDDCPSAPCSPAGGAGGAGFGDGPAYGRNSSNAWEPSPSRFSGSASRIVPLPANNAPAAAATTGGMAAAGRPGSDRRASGGSWVGGGERPVSPAAGQVYGNPCSGGPVQQFTAPYGNGCDGGACMVNGGGPDEAGAEPAPWLRRGGGGDIHAEAAGGGGGAAFGRQISSPVPDAAASAGGAGWGVSLPTPSRLAHSSTAGVAGLDGPGQGGPSGYDSHGGGGGGSRLSSARGGLRGGGVPAVVVHSGGGGTSGGGVSVASSALRAALAQGGAGGSRSSQAAHMHDGQSAKPLAVSALRASTTAGGSGGVMSAPVVWSINELCEPAEGEQPEGLYPPASYGGGSAAAGVDGGPYGSSRRASFQAPAPQTQRSLRAERPAALILPIERPGSGRSPAGGAPNSGGGGGGGGGGHHSLRISPAAAAAAGLASCGQDTPMSMPAGAAAAAFSRRITNTSNPMSALVSPTTAAGPSSCAALAGATRDEVMRMLAAESPGRSSMWYDHKARELMQAAEAARGSDGAGRAGMQQQLQPQRQYARPSVPGDGRSSHVLTHSVSAFTQLAATTCCQDPAAAAAAVGADAVPLSAPASALDGYAAASSSVGGAAGSSHVFSLSSRSALQGGPGGGRGGGGGGGLGGTSYSLLGDATGEARRPSAAGPDGGNNSIGRVRGGNYADSAPATHTGLVLPGSLGGLPGSITGGDEDGLFPNGLANHAPDVVGAAAAAILLAPPEQLQQQQAAAAAAFAPGSYHPSRNQSFLQRYASGSGLSERRERVVGGADNGHAAFRARAATISTSGGGRPAALPGSDGLLNTPNAANRPGGTWRAAVTSSTAAAAAASHSPHAHARAVAGAAPKAWDIDAPAVAEARALAAPAVPAAGATRAPAKADPALEPPELVLSAAAAKLASLMSLARLHSDSEEEQEEAEAEGS